MKYEITIFGSGISAKITSYLLASEGYKVCLILDKEKNQGTPSTNLVTFLSKGSLNYLYSKFPKMSSLFAKYSDIEAINCQLISVNKNKSESIYFEDDKKETLGKIVKNIELEDILNEYINQSVNLSIINSNPLSLIENTTDGVTLTLQNSDHIYSDLFILSSSQANITKQLKIKFINKDLEQHALSIDVKGNIKNKFSAFQKFTSDGPLALLPYSDDEASVVWSLRNNSQILQKDNDELAKIISNHLIEHVASLQLINIEKHRLQFTFAKNLFYKNTVLIGNIAHNIHPIAGQGLNLTIKDIAEFMNQISKYTSLGYKFNDQMVLKEFEMKRKIDNTAFSFGTILLDDILSSNNKFINYSTRKGFGLIEKSGAFKKFFTRRATGEIFFRSF